MPYRSQQLYLLVIAAAISVCSPVFAQDEGGEGNLSIGLGYRASQGLFIGEQSGLKLYINGRYEWRGLFIEYASIPSGVVSLPTLGYNFYNTEHWFLDAVYTWTDGDLRVEGTFNGDYRDFSREQSESFGIRATGAYGDSTLQFAILPFNNEEYDRGTFASAYIARQWQVSNWTLRGVLGAQYRSREIMDFYYGVDPNVAANSPFPEYEAEGGTRFSMLVEANYPLTPHFVLSPYFAHTEFSDSAKDSPIMRYGTEFQGRPENQSEVGIVLNYVF